MPSDILANQHVEYKPLYSKKKLGLPVKNKFIPKNFDIIQKEEGSDSKYPQKVYESEMSELYFK